MNKIDLVDDVATRTGLTKKDSAAAVDAVFAAITSSLVDGGGLTLVGFGSFGVSERSAKEGRNPKTGEKLSIAARKTVRFKPGKALKDAVN